MDDSAVMCDEFIESYNGETKTIPKKFIKKYKIQNFYILLAFFLITMALLIPVSIYCYLIKYHIK